MRCEQRHRAVLAERLSQKSIGQPESKAAMAWAKGKSLPRGFGCEAQRRSAPDKPRADVTQNL